MSFRHQIISVPSIDKEDTPNGRFYKTPTGTKYPSVTTVLGILSEGYLEEWRDRIGHEEADKITRAAAQRGMKTHACVESFVRNETVYYPNPFIELLSKQIIYNLEDNLNTVYAIEQPLFSHYLKLGGQADLIGVYAGKNSIIDYKTSKSHKPKEWCHSYFIQEAAYAIMYEERTGIPIEQLVTIIAKEDSTTPTIHIEHRDTWAPELINTIKEWYKQNAEII